LANIEELKGKPLNHEKKNKDNPKTLEEELTEKYHFKSLKDTEEIYYYDSEKGIFVKNAEWLIKQECIKSDPECSSKNVTEVINHIIWNNYTDTEQFEASIEWITAKNCMINLRTGEKKSHSPDFMTTVRIPHNYYLNRSPLPTVETSCPAIMKFLYEVMSSENVQTFLDFAAYCLWREYLDAKWLVLNGSGRNGKGTLIKLLIMVLGRKNVSSESMQRLLERDFSTAQIVGKLANIDADVSKKAFSNTGIMKKITGGDSITVERKFRDPFDATIYAKLIISGNGIPETLDETDAFFARPIIINFTKQFLGDRQDLHLIDKLTTESEMSGFFECNSIKTSQSIRERNQRSKSIAGK
jgi:putative DNA primase/helicase